MKKGDIMNNSKDKSEVSLHTCKTGFSDKYSSKSIPLEKDDKFTKKQL